MRLAPEDAPFQGTSSSVTAVPAACGYVAEVLRAAGALVLDYVRLNIVARA